MPEPMSGAPEKGENQEISWEFPGEEGRCLAEPTAM